MRVRAASKKVVLLQIIDVTSRFDLLAAPGPNHSTGISAVTELRSLMAKQTWTQKEQNKTRNARWGSAHAGFSRNVDIR
jgi:hypothetical protein